MKLTQDMHILMEKQIIIKPCHKIQNMNNVCPAINH